MASERAAGRENTETPYAPRLLVGAWVAAGWAAVAYGVFLTFTALRVEPGEPLTGQFVGQPVFKALTAVLLAVAAVAHPIVRERRWLMLALVCSALGDFLLAMPLWQPSFVGGLSGFLLAHLCYLGALAPLASRSRWRMGGVAAMCALCVALLTWFWPYLDKLRVPVTVYITVLCAMVCAALLARLPTAWTAVGAVCFAVSDAMIGIDRFILQSDVLAVPIWWVYAMSQLLITAGFFFGRQIPMSRVPESAPESAPERVLDGQQREDQSDPADTPEG